MSFPLNRHEDAGVHPSNAGIAPTSNRNPLEPILPSPSRPSPRSLRLPAPVIASDTRPRARYDQAPLASGSTSYASSISHERTTLSKYSGMEIEMDRQRNAKPAGAEDAGSVYSYNSTRDVSQFVKELHGRIFNNLSESYLLPSDQAEWARLDKQGSALAIGFDGLYPCPEIVEAVLLPVEGERRRILDIGCGTGAWAMQMAVKFPHASVLGVDLAPSPIDIASFPPNLSLEIDDITLGLSHFAGQIDLVHMRCVAGGILDMDKTLEDLQLCLKPGGLVLVIDGDLSALSEDRKSIVPFKRMPGDGGPEVTSVSENGSWWRRLAWEAGEACEIAGSSLGRAEDLYELGFWDHPLVDPETARSGGVDLPIGPWAKTDDSSETQLLQYVGVLMRQNLMSIHRAYHAIMLKHGMDQETLDDWSRHTDEELQAMSPRFWIHFRFLMARRRAGEGLPAPPLPSFPTSESSPVPVGATSVPGIATEPTAANGETGQRRAGRLPYPAFQVCYTREENMQRMLQRRSTWGVFPPSVLRGTWEKLQSQAAS